MNSFHFVSYIGEIFDAAAVMTHSADYRFLLSEREMYSTLRTLQRKQFSLLDIYRSTFENFHAAFLCSG
jgi:hypothetical protein